MKTPRTDKAQGQAHEFSFDLMVVPASLAAELETELEQAKSQARMDISSIRQQHQAEWNEHKSDEDLLAENKAMRKSLQHIIDNGAFAHRDNIIAVAKEGLGPVKDTPDTPTLRANLQLLLNRWRWAVNNKGFTAAEQLAITLLISKLQRVFNGETPPPVGTNWDHV